MNVVLSPGASMLSGDLIAKASGYKAVYTGMNCMLYTWREDPFWVSAGCSTMTGTT